MIVIRYYHPLGYSENKIIFAVICKNVSIKWLCKVLQSPIQYYYVLIKNAEFLPSPSSIWLFSILLILYRFYRANLFFCECKQCVRVLFAIIAFKNTTSLTTTVTN